MPPSHTYQLTAATHAARRITLYVYMYFLVVVAIALALKLHGADAGAVLMGIQVTPQNASDADFESYLSRAVTIAQRSAPYFRSLGHNFSTFVCISPVVSIRQRILLLNKCFQYEIPHIAVSSAAMEASGVCTIEHPDLERYDALFHLNFDTTMSYFDFEAPGFDENYFVAPTVDIVEAKLLYRALYLPPNSSRRSVSSIIVDLLKDSNFSLLVYLPVHISPASPTTDPRFPLFQPAASESVQKSGMCSLQWPRNGTEQYSMNKKHQTVYLWNKWIIDCDIDPEPDEMFTISFVGKVIPGFEQVTFSGSRFHGGELILPHLVKADIGKSEDVLGLSLVLSSRQRVLADFSFHFKVVFSESSESTSSLVNAMISQAPHRLDIGTFLNGLCLLGTLIEVGFSDEAFTSALLGQWMGASYVAVTY